MSMRTSASLTSMTMSSSISGVTSTAATARLPTRRLVERADPDEPVHAALRLEEAVGVVAARDEGGLRAAGLLAGDEVGGLDLQPFRSQYRVYMR